MLSDILSDFEADIEDYKPSRLYPNQIKHLISTINMYRDTLYQYNPAELDSLIAKAKKATTPKGFKILMAAVREGVQRMDGVFTRDVLGLDDVK